MSVMPLTNANDRYHAWVRERVAVAKRLNEGECGGSYGDAMLILSAILSGLAADLWPGKRKDRHRFVELWATHARPDLNPNLISVPLLLEDLQKSGDTALVNKLSAIYPEAFSRKINLLSVTGEQVDRTEEELMSLDSKLASKDLRHFSYGDVFYKHVRSGYTHEYHTTDSAIPFPMTSEPTPVSYVPVLVKQPQPQTQRRIYFDVAWVAKLVESVSDSVTPLMHQEPLAEPTSWWIDG